jgi:Holliday junction resolvase RusA-like endonuclease
MATPTSLIVHLPLDPLTLSINRRYLSNKTVPASVKKAQGDVITVARAQANRERVSFADAPAIRLTLAFTFRGLQGDVSNAVKRVEDALAEALGFNDARVAELHVYRQLGEPGIWAKVEEMDPPWMTPGN